MPRYGYPNVSDLARKEPCDRNMNVINNYWVSTPAPHAWTERWSYTVPADHLYENSLIVASVVTAITTAGSICTISIQISLDGGTTWRDIFQLTHFSTVDAALSQTITALFFLKAGHMVRARTMNNDSINHTLAVGSLGMEFDA